jgi:hypothetical protein
MWLHAIHVPAAQTDPLLLGYMLPEHFILVFMNYLCVYGYRQHLVVGISSSAWAPSTLVAVRNLMQIRTSSLGEELI